jgi:vanillate O-demethylase monooxygenase subunit
MLGAELVTPETDTTCHYFWSTARNFRRQDTAFGDALRQAIGSVFTNEDGAMIATVQANMGSQTDLVAMRPVILPTDRAAIQARMTLRRLIAQENRQSAAAELVHA